MAYMYRLGDLVAAYKYPFGFLIDECAIGNQRNVFILRFVVYSEDTVPGTGTVESKKKAKTPT